MCAHISPFVFAIFLGLLSFSWVQSRRRVVAVFGPEGRQRRGQAVADGLGRASAAVARYDGCFVGVGHPWCPTHCFNPLSICPHASDPH